MRISASLRHRYGAEIIRYDSRPFDRAELRCHLDEPPAGLEDDDGYTIDESRCAVTVRREPSCRL
jgi:hypothetical protein